MKLRKIVRIVGILGFVLQLSTIWGTVSAHDDTTIHNVEDVDRNDSTERVERAKQVTVVSIPGLSFWSFGPSNSRHCLILSK